ncbi:antitoxin Xre/MbcA/ParS toxin-binding domain-containing protein [Larkinella bovis]|uniref:Antitoxin Xre/MbcA/ParS toxin-binding domain-containing protein n=1 Tax=Larkinella bovis TaxID=683041 RepID=A0ABW0ILJ7_9BACT
MATVTTPISYVDPIKDLWDLKAGKLFASPKDFKNWLNRANSMLKGQKPVDLLNKPESLQQVIKVLGRMEHGIMA